MKTRLLLLALVAVVLVLAAACTKDDDGAPQIVDSRAGSNEGSGPAPEIIDRGSGSTGLTVLPGVASAAGAAGLTVSGRASATVPADEATIVVLLPFLPSGPGPVVTLPQRDRDAIIAAVQALGISPDAVSFESNPNLGPFASVEVKVAVGEVAANGQNIVTAISQVRGSQSSGVRFGLADCSTALAPLRKQAFDAAAADAASFAAAIALDLGPVIAVTDTPSFNPYGPALSPCDASSGQPKLPGNLAPLDSRAEVLLDVGVSVTYAFGDSGGVAAAPVPELTATGQGHVKAKANEAYVLIATSIGGGGPFGPPQLQTRQRQELIAEIEKLGVDEDDIQIDSAAFGGPLLVYVEVELDELPQIGRDIASAVQNVIGSAEQQGVQFTHTKCVAVLEEARKQAVADAIRQAESLARAAGTTLTGLVSISESSITAPYGQPANACSEDFRQLFQYGPYAAALVPFDAPAEFTVTSMLLLRFGIDVP